MNSELLAGYPINQLDEAIEERACNTIGDLRANVENAMGTFAKILQISWNEGDLERARANLIHYQATVTALQLTDPQNFRNN